MAMSLLGYSHTDFQRMPRGAQGYKSMFRQSLYGVSILFDGKKDMGIHVNIPGKAMHDCLLHFPENIVLLLLLALLPMRLIAFDVSFYSSVLRDLLRKIQEKGHLTRFDIAIDDIGANYYLLPAWIRNLQITSMFLSSVVMNQRFLIIPVMNLRAILSIWVAVTVISCFGYMISSWNKMPDVLRIQIP